MQRALTAAGGGAWACRAGAARVTPVGAAAAISHRLSGDHAAVAAWQHVRRRLAYPRCSVHGWLPSRPSRGRGSGGCAVPRGDEARCSLSLRIAAAGAVPIGWLRTLPIHSGTGLRVTVCTTRAAPCSPRPQDRRGGADGLSWAAVQRRSCRGQCRFRRCARKSENRGTFLIFFVYDAFFCDHALPSFASRAHQLRTSRLSQALVVWR